MAEQRKGYCLPHLFLQLNIDEQAYLKGWQYKGICKMNDNLLVISTI